MTLQSLPIFFGLTFGLSLAAHWFVRRYWWAVLVAVGAASLVNLAHEAFLHDFHIRPADLAFWIPMDFFFTMLFALPIAVLVGVPSYVIRYRRPSDAP